MSGTVNLQQRLQQLKRVQADLETVLYQAQKQATKKAVQAAADATPPKKGTGRGPYIGTNTMTGELKALGFGQQDGAGDSWATVCNRAGKRQRVCVLCQRRAPDETPFRTGAVYQSGIRASGI